MKIKNVGPIGGPETSVINYRYPLRNNPAESSFHRPCGGSLNSRMVVRHVVYVT